LPTADAEPPPADAGPPPAPGFAATFEKWVLPESGQVRGFFQGNISSGSSLNWFLLDLDGNGQLELVQTSDPIFASPFVDATGDFWKVFTPTGSGFAETHTPLRLPDIDVGGPGFYSKRGPGWDLVDLDNDSILDLILLTDPETDQLWPDGKGVSWRMLKGTGTSFADPTPWPVPDLGTGPFKSMERCDGTLGCWQVVDINADGFADLVHSADAGAPTTVWDALTTPNWHVYLNDGSGFSTNVIQWQLPTAAHEQGFFRPNLAAYWRIVDLDGDDAAELVQTRPFPIGAGPFYEGQQPFWHRFQPRTEGFEVTPTNWDVPIGTTPFDSMGKAQDSLFWETIDIDGDGLLDLVHTANSQGPTPAVWGAPNSDQWKVYLGTTSGFSSVVTSWPLPDSERDDGFYGLNVSEVGHRWMTIDLDGDGQVELVQTADPATDAVWRDETNRPFWKVFRRSTN
jgi:hypothetical protein